MASPLPHLLEAIGRALGTPRPPGSVISGAVGPGGHVAWIEAPGEVSRLFVAAGGKVVVEQELARGRTDDWGYEGCWVSHLSWCAEHVVVISSESHATHLWSVGVPGRIAPIPIGGGWAVDGDLVLWPSDDQPGLLAAIGLPSLLPRTPLPVRSASPRLRLEGEAGTVRVFDRASPAEGEVERLTLPSATQRGVPGEAEDFLGLVARRVFDPDPVPPSGRVVVEATALPFCHPRRSGSPSPVWIPVYWHRHLAATGHASDAAELLALLDAIAAPLPDSQPERGWDPAWELLEGAVTLAERHVRRQARRQAGVCRSGELPRGWWCLLFEPAPGRTEAGSRVDAGALPPALRRVFETLAVTRPAPLPHRL